MTKRKKIIFAVVTIAVVSVAVYLIFGRGSDEPVAPVPEQKYYSQLTGKEVDQAVSEQPLLGVMIENSEEARPQEGLGSAGIVFETVTEGGITRYLALFQENMPKEIGPVRSVRPYFVDWFMGFDASIAHVGGSAEAIEMINDRSAKSLNQFFNPEPYYRRTTRAAPHNMYARMNDLVALQIEKGHKTANITAIPRKDDAPIAEPTAKVIAIRYSAPLFSAQFTYDPTTNTYKRNLAGAAHIDAASNKQIAVNNLVVIKMKSTINAIGSGEAIVFMDGSSQTVKWEQKDYKSRIKLIDADGNEVALNRGNTWFAVIPGTGSVSF